MRKLITGLFVAAMSFGVVEAQASQQTWKCVGASYVCGGASKSKLGTSAQAAVRKLQHEKEDQKVQC